jgi:CheY-like chemotaxis protein
MAQFFHPLIRGKIPMEILNRDDLAEIRNTAPGDRTILIVEDNLDFHMLTKLALKKCGYKVESLFDGKLKDVLKKILTCDIVLLDVDLPSESGSSISSGIKSDPRTNHIPIIMITGNAEGPEICTKAHADACLIKPFPFASLLQTIEKVFTAQIRKSDAQ